MLTMTSFGWKRKIGQSVSREKSAAFEDDAKEDEDEEITSGTIDWLTLAPSRKVICLEDAKAKSHRLKQEGATLAEQERFWEALKKWDGAIDLNPQDASLHEMKAQAYMHLCEVYPALQSATRAVNIDPLWWVARQTLGRAHLGLGEVRLALRSFSKAAHLYPGDLDLWEEDLRWAYDLLQRKQTMTQQLEQQERAKHGPIVRELPEEGDHQLVPSTGSEATRSTDTPQQQELAAGDVTLNSANYVRMRDTVT